MKKRSFVFITGLALFLMALSPVSAARADELEKFIGDWTLDLSDTKGRRPLIKIYSGDSRNSLAGYMNLDDGYQTHFNSGAVVETKINDGLSKLAVGPLFDEETGELLLHTEYWGRYPLTVRARLVPGKPDRLIVRGTCVERRTAKEVYSYEYEFLRAGQGVKSGKGRGQSTAKENRPEWFWMIGEWKSASGGAARAKFTIDPGVHLDFSGTSVSPSLEWNAEKHAYELFDVFNAGANGGIKVIRGYIRTPSGTPGPSDTLEVEFIQEYPDNNKGYGQNGRPKFSAVLSKAAVFQLKDGQVYRDGAALDCEVHEVSPEIKGSIRFWSPFGPEAGAGVRESETGVWFFTGEGANLTFAPLESAQACQTVTFNPRGDMFVLGRGSGARPDLTYELHGEWTEEKLAEFAGIRGDIQWIDPVRLVFTRIDDGIRENGSFMNLAYGLRLSVVMYDTKDKETTVLKEATDTKNYSLLSVTGGGTAVSVTEASVKSEADWADEDQIAERVIEVEIPARVEK